MTRPSADKANHRADMVKDGIVSGYINPRLKQCHICKKFTWCIDPVRLQLPEREGNPFKVEDPRIIFNKLRDLPHARPYSVPRFFDIGIGCGCYAKAHRQLAHIGK